jgi:hypothetical protein
MTSHPQPRRGSVPHPDDSDDRRAIRSTAAKPSLGFVTLDTLWDAPGFYPSWLSPRVELVFAPRV